jgi:hypothetical protein
VKGVSIFIGKKTLNREEANKALLEAVREGVDCCAEVGKYNPGLANTALMLLARIAVETGKAEIHG